MTIQVLHKPSGRTGTLEYATYYSRAACKRTYAEAKLVQSFIGSTDPPSNMRMKIRLTGGVGGAMNCQPRDLMRMKKDTMKSLIVGCKSIW